MHTHKKHQPNLAAALSELNASPFLQADSSCYLKSEVGNLLNFKSVFQQAQVQRKATKKIKGIKRLLGQRVRGQKLPSEAYVIAQRTESHREGSRARTEPRTPTERLGWLRSFSAFL